MVKRIIMLNLSRITSGSRFEGKMIMVPIAYFSMKQAINLRLSGFEKTLTCS